MPVPNNNTGAGLPKRPQGSNRPIPSSRPAPPRLPREEELPNLPDFSSPRAEKREETEKPRGSVRPEGRRGTPSEEYNFDAGKAALRNKPSFRNEFDESDDDTFSSLTVDEQLDYEDAEDQEAQRKAAKRRAAERRAEQEVERLRAERQAKREQTLQNDDEILFDDEDDNLPDTLDDDDEDEDEPAYVVPKKEKKRKPVKDITEDNVKDEYGQDVFIDEKTGKLLPFGTKKNKKKKTKEHEYDSRKNMRTNSTIARFIFLALGLILVGFGLKNTFFPVPALSEEEITGIVAETADLTNYPLERGGGFAKDFIQAYLSTDPEGSTTNESVLGYFYTGNVSADEGGVTNRVFGNGYSQNIIYGPTIYESKALTDYSARYTIGAVVKPAGESPDPTVNNAKWIFMNVNVYYNETTDSFTITPDSPAVLPNVPVGDVSGLPAEQSLGEEITDTAVIDKIQPVVYGFLNGYRQSSPEDHSTLDQYIIGDASAALEKGLDNQYNFFGDAVESATQYNVYADADDPGLMKVKTTVTWTSGAADNGVEFTSTYVIFLREQSNGMYLVERFQPFYFVANEENLAEQQANAEAEAATTEEESVVAEE